MSNQTKTLYYDIDGIMCNSCTKLIETGLLKDKEVEDVSINLATKRARVVVKENTPPKYIIDAISAIDTKFVAKWLPPEDEKTYYFSVRGMTSPKDAQLIKDKLNERKEDINSSSVNYSTGIATITTFAPKDQEQSKILSKKLKKLIKEAIEGREIKAKRIKPEANEVPAHDTSTQYRRRALVNALVGIPLLLLSPFIPLPLTLMGQFIGIFIGGVIFGVMWQTGKEFYKGAWNQLVKNRSSDMNTLIALGTSSAWIYSMLIVLIPGMFPLAALQYHFLAINMILGIVNLGKSLRANAEHQTKNKVKSLAQVYVDLQPQYAKVLRSEFKEDMLRQGLSEQSFKEIHYKQIKEGDIVQVMKDQRVPVEGVIISDDPTFVNEETLTGEPEGRNKSKGDEVCSGSLNMKHTIYIRASRDGKEGHLTKVIDDVNKSSATKPPSISKLVDRLAVVFVPMIVSIAALSACGWFLLGPVPALPWMIKSVMSVLLCACPCALGLATPISTAIGMYKQFNKKILVHDAAALEIAAQVNTVVFDKTGTLTSPAIHHAYIPAGSDNWSQEEVIQFAASLEKSFDHPIAKSFMTGNSSHDFLPCEQPEKKDEGVSGIVAERMVVIGSLAHLESKQIVVPEECKQESIQNELKGMSSVYVAIDAEVFLVAFKHEIRKDARETIEQLRARDIEIFMLTGDQEEPAKVVARELGIRKVFAKMGSRDKKDFVLELKAHHRIVAVVGDGLNDIEAMEAADLGIAVGSWTHASSVAKVATQQLNFIPLLIMARETMNNIHQNLYWTGFYNLLSLTAATGLLYYIFGFVLNPVVASLLMAISSISVVINSMRLSRQIDYKMAIYEGKIQPPTTLLEKIQQYIPFQGVFDALLTAFSSSAEDQPAARARGAEQIASRVRPGQYSPPNTPVKGKQTTIFKGRSDQPIYIFDDIEIKKEEEQRPSLSRLVSLGPK